MRSKPLDALTRLESLAERWLEGGFARLFGTRLHLAELAEQLTRALEDGRTAGPDGLWLAPDDYQVFLHPGDYARFSGGRDRAEIERKLTHHLIEFAQRGRVTLMRRPQIRFSPSDRVPSRQVRVQARLTQPPPPSDEPFETREIESGQPQQTTETPLPNTRLSSPGSPRPDGHAHSYNLLFGERWIPLTTSPVNLGRDLDNDIVIDHPRVSRHHAQLRQRGGEWWLIDLGSTNGIAVNSQPASEAILHPGDIISLSGVEIRFEIQPPSTE